jgi:ribose 1,5-bisphosphokinase
MSAAQPSTLAALLGPGRLILVVGPSGAGKDTILAGAKQALSQNRNIIFPRRVVTREANSAEDHGILSEAEFERQRDAGAFVLSWQAHGLYYGIPGAIDDDIRAGRVVLCNVSRGIVEAARARYANVTVVLITAPMEVLALRLSGRARESDGPTGHRLRRNDAYPGFAADIVIDNSGAADTAVRQLLHAISG